MDETVDSGDNTVVSGDAGAASRQLLAQLAQIASQGDKQGDPLHLANSDNPRTLICSVKFDGSNYYAWSRQIQMGLGTKLKLGFLDGSTSKPAKNSPDLQRWTRADGMVACWLLGSMTPDIASTFVYIGAAKDLWSEIQERYSHGNAPMVYKLKLELMRTVQGDMSVTAYYSKLKKFLFSLGYKQSLNDYSLFTRFQGDSSTVLLVYVGDILLTGSDLSEIGRIKSALHDKFTIKDLGEARYFLGMEIQRTEQGNFLSQKKYVQDILDSTHMSHAKAALFPLLTGLKLRVDQGELLTDVEQYRRIIGRLLYLAFTRPNISYAVQHLSQFVSQPRVPHFAAAQHVLRYLRGTSNKGLFYPVQTDFSVVGFTDSDWGSCASTGRSLTGFCVFFGHSLVSWKTKKQTTVSRSSTEAEYRSMAATTSELVWTNFLLADLHLPAQLPITLFCDNRSAQQIAANPCFHERTKHIELDCHFIREKIQSGFLQTAHISTKHQLADVMTKPLCKAQHEYLVGKLGLVDLPT